MPGGICCAWATGLMPVTPVCLRAAAVVAVCSARRAGWLGVACCASMQMRSEDLRDTWREWKHVLSVYGTIRHTRGVPIARAGGCFAVFYIRRLNTLALKGIAEPSAPQGLLPTLRSSCISSMNRRSSMASDTDCSRLDVTCRRKSQTFLGAPAPSCPSANCRPRDAVREVVPRRRDGTIDGTSKWSQRQRARFLES